MKTVIKQAGKLPYQLTYAAQQR